MQIKTSKDLQKAIELAKSGDYKILFDIAKFISYKFYMNDHIKEGSEEDLKNEKIYYKFKEEFPELYQKVEEWVDYNFKKFNNDFD